MANTLITARRRGRITLAPAQQAAALVDALPIEFNPQAARRAGVEVKGV